MSEITASPARIIELERELAQKKRELEIESVVEKVRNRSLEMYKSEELQEVANTLFGGFKELEIHVDSANIAIFKEGTRDYEYWVASDFQSRVAAFHMPYTELSFTKDLIAARESGIDFSAKYYSYEEKNEWFNYAFENTDFKFLSDERKQFILGSKGVFVSIAFGKHTGVQVTKYSETSLTDLEILTLKRFSKVFEQAYIRFLDLQKAEAQARESQIELALERVRARTMAMQRSDELAETAQLLYTEFRTLNINTYLCGFCFYKEERDKQSVWVTLPDGTIIPDFVDFPITGDPVLNKRYDDWKHKKALHVYELQGEENKEHHRFLASKVIDRTAQEIFSHIPERIIFYCANFSTGYLLIIATEFLRGQEHVITRFAKVFEQTYTRFLDLQKAETQAREAIKRASVDRVRAEIASMRTTNDLERITPLIWSELSNLGVPFFRCGILIMDDEQQEVHSYLSTPDGKAVASFVQPYNTPGEVSEVVKSWHKKELYTQYWDESRFLEFANSLLEQGAISDREKFLTQNHPGNLYLHFIPFLQGMLYAGNTVPLTENELQLVKTLADAFSSAYARYEDFNKLESAKKQVDGTLNELRATQKQLIQSEKMASLGELTAGIAHEIQNPLNFVNNFSDVNKELAEELEIELDKRNYMEAKELTKLIKSNEEKINQHGKRADTIVKGMMQHSTGGSGQKEPTELNLLCDEYFRLAYHACLSGRQGLRAKDKFFTATTKTDFDDNVSKINIVPQEIGRAILNIVMNAFYTVNEKKQFSKEGYEPTVSISTRKVGDKVEITVQDNGNGISPKIVDKIFQPFFTTKPTGQGTGLGLSLAYDIVKAHGGEINIRNRPGEGADFIITLPVNA